MIDAAQELSAQIKRYLDDPRTEQILLTRDEAALIKGFIDGAREAMENEDARSA